MSDAFMIDAIKAGAGAFGDILNFGINAGTTAANLFWRQKDFDTNEYWRNIAQQNYREQMDFQKMVYGEQKEREDTAISRRVKDMQSVGLNPVNALGASASASANTVATPHFNPQASNPIMMKQVNFDNAIAMAQLQMQKKLNDANVNKIDSETNLNNARYNDVVASEEERRANIDFLKSKTNLTDKQVEEVGARMSLIQAQVDLTQKEAYKITKETDNIIANNKVIKAQYDKLVNDVKIQNINAYEQTVKNNIIAWYGEQYKESILTQWEKSSAELQLLHTTNATRISTDVRNWTDLLISTAFKAVILAGGL